MGHVGGCGVTVLPRRFRVGPGLLVGLGGGKVVLRAILLLGT
jgi:hypothetical protein